MNFIEFVNESLDQPYPVEWDNDLGDNYSEATFETKDGSRYLITFNIKLRTGTWHDEPALIVDFKQTYSPQWKQKGIKTTGSRNITGTGDAPRVFATVVHSTRHVYQQQKDQLNYIIFSADTREGNSRPNLYRRIANRFAKEFNGEVIEHEHESWSSDYGMIEFSIMLPEL